MALHLVKLCVGVASVADLRASIDAHVPKSGRGDYLVVHTTRTLPKRADEIVGRGSIYWVIKGHVCARQAIRDLQPFVDRVGTPRCRIVLSPEVVDVSPQPRKMFQGWRYLTDEDAPDDLDGISAGLTAMPETMRRELATLGLL